MTWVVLALVVVVAGYMIVDGLHALTRGDYITPRSGGYVGQLGPWSRVVAAVGLAPRSTLVKSVFVGYGFAYLAAAVLLVLGVPGAPIVLGIVAALGLWYLPFGTLLNAIAIVLLLVTA